MANADVTFATEAELEQIATIRSKLETELKALTAEGKDFPHVTGDILFTRLIRGNNGDVDEAVKWYRNFLQLRTKWGLDDIHKDCEANKIPWVSTAMPHSAEVLKYLNTVFDVEKLRTASGNPVWYDAVGDSKTKEMLEKMKQEDVVKFFHYALERRCSMLDELSRTNGKLIKIVKIIDLEGAGIWSFNREWSKFEKEFVNTVLIGSSIETVQLIFVINFSSFWTKLFDTLKPLFPARLRARIRLLDKDYIQNKEFLTEVGPTLSQQLVANNKCHALGSTDDATQLEGSGAMVPAGRAIERIVQVTKGQRVSWEYAVGNAGEATGGYQKAGFFSKMASKFAGSEIVFSVSAYWTDILPTEVQTVPARVKSAGSQHGDTAEFWLDGKQIEYTPETGLNLIAVNPETMNVILSKAYDMVVKFDTASKELVSDINAIPRASIVLVAVKGTGAENISEEAWDALADCGAKMDQGHWNKGYALIGTKGGICQAELRGENLEAEGNVPLVELQGVLVDAKEITAEMGSQNGSIDVDREGMVVVRWSNWHSFVANKTISQFKVAVE